MDRRPMNTPLQWGLVLCACAMFVLGASVPYRRWAEGVKARQSLPIAWCPNYDSVRVYRVDWASRSNVYAKTIPATCGDTTAVTYGYLR